MIGIRDLARHLDISIGTVSRALNDRADVNPLTRQRVREAAAKLGYSPNQSGRSLRRGRTDLIGMIVPGRLGRHLDQPVFLSVLDGLKRRLGEHDLDLAIFLEGGSDDRLGALRRVTERGLADALIIADTESFDPRVDYLAKLAQAVRHLRADANVGATRMGRSRFRGGGRRARSSSLLRSGIGGSGSRCRTFAPTISISSRPATGARCERAAFLSTNNGTCVARRASEAVSKPRTRCSQPIRGRPRYSSANPCTRSRFIDGSTKRVLRPGRDISILGLLPEARAQYLIPTLTTYQTNWTEIGRRLADAVTSEIAAAVEREPADGTASAPLQARVQYTMPVEFSPGESLHRVENNG